MTDERRGPRITTVFTVARTPARAGRGAALGLTLAAACGLTTRAPPAPAPLEAGVQLLIPTLVHWDSTRDRHLDFAIENGTRSTLSLAAPDAAHARVAVFPGGDDVRLCGVEPRGGEAPAGPAIELPPGGRVAIRVDLAEACAGVPAGDYRFEVEYHAPPVAGRDAFSGAIATRYGELRVRAPAPEPAPSVERPAARRAARTPPRR